MNTLADWIPLIIALVGGSGGGAVMAWINNGRQRRLDERQQSREERDDGLTALMAKKELRKLVDDVAGEMITSLRAENKEAIALIKQQQAEIHELYKKISLGDRKLLEASRQLAVAEAELQRKESVIVKLQQVVAGLEATIAELRQRLLDCAGSTAAPMVND